MVFPFRTLPRSKRQSSISNRNVQRRAHQRSFDMPRHVVITLHGVSKGPIVVPRGRNNLVECDLQIASNVRIRIFVNGQGRRRVLHKEVAHAHFDLREILGNDLLDIAGDKMASPGGSRNRQLVLEPLHGHLFLLRGLADRSWRGRGGSGSTRNWWNDKASDDGNGWKKEKSKSANRRKKVATGFHGKSEWHYGAVEVAMKPTPGVATIKDFVMMED